MLGRHVPRGLVALLALATAGIACGGEVEGPGASRLSARESNPRFRGHGSNPTVDTTRSPVARVGPGFDEASVALVVQALGEGRLPPRSMVRPESFVNSLDYQYPPPGPAGVALRATSFPSLHREGYDMLRIGLVFDASSIRLGSEGAVVFAVSVGDPEDLGSVRDALLETLGRIELVAERSVGLVGPGFRVAPTRDVTVLVESLDQLRAGRSLAEVTENADALAGRTGTVILLSDGFVAGVPLEPRPVPAPRLDILAVGAEVDDDILLELSGAGGRYRFFAPDKHASLMPQPQAVQIRELEVTLDPAVVERYRVIGYERAAASAPAPADQSAWLDGGATTLLFEIKRTPKSEPSTSLGKVSVKTRGDVDSSWTKHVIDLQANHFAAIDQAPPDARLAAVAGLLAEKLRGSFWVTNLEWSELRKAFARLPAASRSPPSAKQLGALLDQAAELDPVPDSYAIGERAAQAVRSVPVFAEDEP